MNLFWMFLILRIALNIVFRSKVVDVRSDDEDTDNELEKKERVAQGTTVAVETVGGSQASAVDMNGTAVGANGSTRKREGVKQES
jgi:acyl-CoA-dependent ceramide synthase